MDIIEIPGDWFSALEEMSESSPGRLPSETGSSFVDTATGDMASANKIVYPPCLAILPGVFIV